MKKNNFFTNLAFRSLLVLLLSTPLLSSQVDAKPFNEKEESTLISLQLAPNRLVHLQVLQAKESNKATFLMLPGVNRSLLMNEPLAQLLSKRGYGVAIMNFSTQPFSINLLEPGQTPYFKNKKFQLTDLANEVETVITYLKTRLKISQVVPVSLSFSAAVSPYLQSTDLVVEVAPLTSTSAANPVLGQTIRNLKAAELFNPYFGPSFTRSTLDSIYRNEWKAAVDLQIKTYQLQSEYKENMIEGYTTMSRTVEGFEWEKTKLSQKIKRIFVLAENETGSLLKNQSQTILNILKQDVPASIYMIKNSGHIIPSDQPELLSVALIHGLEVGLPNGELAEVETGLQKLKILNFNDSQLRLKQLSN